MGRLESRNVSNHHEQRGLQKPANPFWVDAHALCCKEGKDESVPLDHGERPWQESTN